MKKTLWNNDWKFWEEADTFAMLWNVPENACDVRLPHDAMHLAPARADSPNGGNTGYRDGGRCIYVKTLHVDETMRGRTFIAEFEGVYMNAMVYINGALAAKRPYGYSGFLVSLGEHLRYGADNEIRVFARAGAMPNCRWYSGAGIYRDVYLHEAGSVYICPNALRVRTLNADNEVAALLVEAELSNRSAATAHLILQTEIFSPDGQCVANGRVPVALFPQEQRVVPQRLHIHGPQLWGENTPQMYTIHASLLSDDDRTTPLDIARDSFGIRDLRLDSRYGLRVNGESVKLRGACIHHDSGLLGAATYDAVQFRQIRRLKEAGFNAVRMAHQPMAPAMLRACDRLGVYVIDESFDMWTRCKSPYDYAQCFDEWWERDLEAMARKDYNHPCVISYSIGNEIPEIATDEGARLCAQLSARMRALDPGRFVLACINGSFIAGEDAARITADIHADATQGEDAFSGNVNEFLTMMDAHLDEIVLHEAITARLEKVCPYLDISGYNYMTARYLQDAARYPDRIMVGSETYPPDIARNWRIVKSVPQLLGDFTWTGWDYIGEAGVGIPAYQWGEGGFGAAYPAQLAYTGDMEITGFRRPLSYWREIVFGLRHEPYIAVQDPRHYGQTLIKTPWVLSDTLASWTWPGYEEKPIVIEVYSPGTHVELYLDDSLIGSTPAGDAADYRALFETVYRPGRLEAVAFDGNHEIGRTMLQTACGKKELHLYAEQGDGSFNIDLIYINAVFTDRAGTTVPNDDEDVFFAVEGGARLLACGSGDPKPLRNTTGTVARTWHGVAQAILERTGTSAIHVTAWIESGCGCSLELPEAMPAIVLP